MLQKIILLNSSMNKYIATIRLKGLSVKTIVFADSPIHARLLLQFQFGMECIVSSPSITNEEDRDYKLIDDLINEYGAIKPLTPQQSRINSLKKQKDNATKALKVEKNRQKITKAQQQISTAISQNSNL
jgi:hypothetical protein